MAQQSKRDEKWVPTYCNMCNAGAPDLMKVHVVDGVAVGIEPNHDFADIHPGEGKQIVWDVLKDVENLKGNGIVFEVRAVRPRRSRPWLWVAGVGALAATAGAAAVVLQDEEKESTIVLSIPDPEEYKMSR